MQKIKNNVKNSKFISLFFLLGCYILYFILDKTQNKEKKIMFVSFSGRQYSDSPKILFEEISQRKDFNEYELVWAFNKPDEFKDELNVRTLNINSFSFLKELFSSKIWISNASIEKLVPYKSNKIFYLNTWHGIPLKKIGADEKDVSPLVANWYKKVKFDVLTVNSDYDKEIFNKIFPNTKKMIKSGIPRNNKIIYSEEKKNKVKNDFQKKNNLKIDKKLILYAPTFRGNASTSINPILSGQLLPEEMDNSYLLIRTHYFEKNHIEHPCVLNVSDDDLIDLFNICDCLITDYSSIMFDFSHLKKPIFLYCFDYDEYERTRGMYIDLKNNIDVPIIVDNLQIKNIYNSLDMDLSINKWIESLGLDLEPNLEELYDTLKEYISYN